MKSTWIGAAAVIGGLALSQSAHGADTMLLAGVGGLSNTRGDGTPVVTLKGDSTTTADTIAVAHGGGHGGGFHGGGGHGGGFHGGGYHHGGMAHAGSFHAGHYGGYHHGGYGHAGYGHGGYGHAGYYHGGWGHPYHNHGWYGRYGYGGWGWGWGRGWGGWGWPGYGWYGPGISVAVGGYYPSYYGVGYTEPVVVSCADVAPISAPAVAVEVGPQPKPAVGYRYDGGPARPVPLPATPSTPPPPAAFDAVARRPVSNLQYPAYGETPGKLRATRVPDPLLVKNTQGK